MTSEPGSEKSRGIAYEGLDYLGLGLAAIAYLSFILLAFGVWDAWAGAQNAGIPDFIESSVGNPPATDADRDNRMLAAQEAMAGFASWMFLVSVATVAATIVGTVFLLRQIRLTGIALEEARRATEEARRSNDIAINTSRGQLRAYVAIHAEVVSYDSGDFRQIKVTVRNTGPTPIPYGEIALFAEVLDHEDVNHGGFAETHYGFAMGAKSEATFLLKRSDGPESVWIAHAQNIPLRFRAKCTYGDVFDGEHRGEVEMWRFHHLDDELHFSPEGNFFD